MTASRRFSPAFRYGALLLLALLAGGRLATLDWSTVLVSSLTTLLPASASEAQFATAAVSEAQGRLLFFGGENEALSPAAAAELESALGTLPGVVAQGVGLRPTAGDALGAVVFEHRSDLFFPPWLAAARARYAAAESATPFPQWLAEAAVADLEAFLEAPESLGFETLVESDPLLLFRLAGAAMEFSGAPPPSVDTVWWLQMAADPLDAAVQTEFLPKLEQALGRYAAVCPDEPVVWFGALRYAAETRSEMQREIAWLNFLTLGGVIFIAVVILRRPWQLAHLLVPVGYGVLGGLAVLTLFFEHVHLLSLVMGSMLGGVAIDYGVHLFFHSRGPGEDRVVVRSLLISGASTIVGYAIWAGSSLVLAQQTGVFVASGLATALLAVLLYPPLRRSTSPRFAEALERPFPFLPRPAQWAVGGMALLLSGVGWWQTEWNDRLEILDMPHPEIDAAVDRITGQIEDGAPSELLIATGTSFLEAASRLRSLEGDGFSLERVFPAKGQLDGIAAFAPQWPAFRSAWETALLAREFEPVFFEDFAHAMEARLSTPAPGEEWDGRVEAAGVALAGAFRGPSSALCGVSGDRVWLGQIEAAASGPERSLPEGVVRLTVRQDLENLLGDWRREQIRLSFLGVVAIGVIVLAALPRGAWLPVLILPVGAVAATLGLVGWAMGGLNLFHFAGCLLGFCVTLDYVVFFENSRRAGEVFPASIRFSALTTAMAFGLLLSSQVEAVRSLGATVATSVVLAILGLELLRSRSTKEGP